MPGVLAWDSPGGGHYCVLHRAQEARQRVPYEDLVGFRFHSGYSGTSTYLGSGALRAGGADEGGHDPDSQGHAALDIYSSWFSFLREKCPMATMQHITVIGHGGHI